MTKQTKSERLFFHAYREAKDSIKTWGFGKIDALSSLHDDTDEVIYQRTVNDIRREAAKYEQDVDRCVRYGVYSEKREALEREALAIVLRTCDNWERDEAELKARLAAL